MEEQWWLGLTLAFLASFFTGSYQVPRKLPYLVALDPPLQEQIYVTFVGLGFTVGCWASCLLLPFNKILMGSPLVGTEFVFTWWGALSGCLVLLAMSVGFFGVRKLGIALNAACSMGAAAVTSFFWGVFVNDDRVSLLLVDVAAVGLIVLGGALAALFKEAGHPAATLKQLVTRSEVTLQRRATFAATTTTAATEEGPEDSEGRPPSGSAAGEGPWGPLEEEGAAPSSSNRPSSVSAPLLWRSTTCPPGTCLDTPDADSQPLPPAAAAAGGGEGSGAGSRGRGAAEGLTVKDRVLGTAASLSSGIIGGASLGPMSFVTPNAKGVAFLPSFGIVVAVRLWWLLPPPAAAAAAAAG
ncbi:hypothetical protein Efla_005144 [Eimeria flavescens]